MQLPPRSTSRRAPGGLDAHPGRGVAYGEQGLVRVTQDARGFWDRTWEAMRAALAERRPLAAGAGERPGRTRGGWSGLPSEDD